MTALRTQFARLPVIAGLLALASTLGLVAAMSSTDGYLQTAMQRHDVRLEAISERAERIQILSRHIRRASLTSQPDVNLPFGGFIGSARQIEPGARLKFGRRAAADGHMLEVVSAHRISPSIELAATATQPVDLMLVTARAADAADAALVRFLVAVTPEKPTTAGTAFDHQTL